MSAVHRIVLPSPNANLKSFLFGLIAICAALALRAVLAPFLLTSHPYTLLFAATAVASWYGAHGQRFSLRVSASSAQTSFSRNR